MAIVNTLSDKIKRSFVSWSQSPFSILILALFFVTLRLILLLTNIESLYWPEEIYRGTIAWEILHGLKLPLLEYLPDHYDGGAIWNAWLTAPLFKWLGSSLFSLKLTGLLIATGSFFVLYGWMKKFFGKTSALLACAFYAFASPVLAATSLYSIGSHSETPLWSAGMFWLFYDFTAEKVARKKLFRLATLGIFTGFAFWYCSITAITALVCLIAWPWMDRSSFRPKWLTLGASFALFALLPFFSYHAAHQFRFLDFLYDAFAASSPGKSLYPAKLFFIPLRFLRLVIQTLPFSFCFKSIGLIPALWLSGLFAFLTLLIMIPFYRKPSPASELPIRIFPWIFLFIYSVSNYGTFYNFGTVFYSYRYFTPFYFMLCPLLALACQRHPKGFLIGLLLCVVGFAGQMSYFFQEPFGRAFQYSGVSYFDLGRVWGSRYLNDAKQIPAMMATAQKFPPYKAHQFLLGITDTAKGGFEGSSGQVINYLKQVPEPYRPYFAEGWGYMLTDPAHLDPKLSQHEALGLDEKTRFYLLSGIANGFENSYPLEEVSKIQGWPREFQPFLLESYGQTLYYTLYTKYGDRQWFEALFTLTHLSPDETEKQKALRIIQSFSADEKIFVLRGFGHGAAIHWSHWQEYGRTFEPLLEIFSPKERSDFYYGMGWGFAQDMRIDRARTLTWIYKLSGDAQRSALQGLFDFEKRYGLDIFSPKDAIS